MTKHGMLLIPYQSVINWNILQKHFETTELTSLRQTKVGAMIFFEIISEKKKKNKNNKKHKTKDNQKKRQYENNNKT